MLEVGDGSRPGGSRFGVVATFGSVLTTPEAYRSLARASGFGRPALSARSVCPFPLRPRLGQIPMRFRRGIQPRWSVNDAGSVARTVEREGLAVQAGSR